jgi:hypothetical protein
MNQKKIASSKTAPAGAKAGKDDKFSGLRKFIMVVSAGSAKEQAKAEQIVLEEIVRGLARREQRRLERRG